MIIGKWDLGGCLVQVTLPSPIRKTRPPIQGVNTSSQVFQPESAWIYPQLLTSSNTVPHHYHLGPDLSLSHAELYDSVSNGSSFGPGQLNRSAWQWPYDINNRQFFQWTITLRPQILIREFSVWYVKYAAPHGASFGSLRISISSNLSNR